MLLYKLLIEIGLILGLLVVAILTVYRKRSGNKSNAFLAAAILSTGYLLFITYLNQTELTLRYPYFFRTGNIAGFLIMPFLYFYSRSTFYPGKQWQKKDWLFFIPALFYIVDMMPVFMMDNEHKIAVLKDVLQNPQRFNAVAEGWLGIAGLQYILIYSWSVLVLVLQIRLIYKNRNMLADSIGSPNRTLFWFIITVTLFHIPLIVPGVFGAIFHLKWYNNVYNGYSLAVYLATSAIYILFNPKIIYGFYPRVNMQTALEVNEKNSTAHASTIEIQHPAKLFLSEIELDDMIKRIDDFMADKKPYLEINFSIHDLARDIEMPVYQLSPIINNHYYANFNTWINKYRVAHFEQLCQQPKNKHLTIDALALQSGFSNRNTLTIAFKKEKNTTPGLFLKQFRNDNTMEAIKDISMN